MESISLVLTQLFTFNTLIAIMIGVVGGIIMGALPGLGATMGVALMVPLTFGMDPVPALIMLTAIYTAAIYGGSISAILIHTPGTPASAATAISGYELTKQGKGLKALGLSTFSSMVGGVISAICLLLIAPPLAQFSLKFSSAEYFLLAVLGLTLIGALSSGQIIKGLFAGALGLFFSTWGVDVLSGYPRFTFGVTPLEAGLSFVPAMIGLFSISQVMILVEDMLSKKAGGQQVTNLTGQFWPRWSEIKTYWKTLISSSIIGVIVGILPGAGGDTASWVALDAAKRVSKNPEKFDTGCEEGVIAPEAANNAVTGGALIPLLTLGIPGSSATAVLFGGLLMQGLQPGHELFSTNAHITYAVILGFLVANILMGIVGWLSAKHVVKIADITPQILSPIIVVLSTVGAYAVNMRVFDIFVMVAFGLIGYYLRKANFPTAAIVLGMILGPIAEKGFRQSIVLSHGNVLQYYMARPICIVLIALIVLSIGSTVITNKRSKKNNLSHNTDAVSES